MKKINPRSETSESLRGLHYETLLCNIHIHKDEVAYTTAHYKQMENFMGTEIFVLCVKKGELQGVNDTTYGINNTTSQ